MATWFPGQVLGLNLCSQCHKDEMVSMFFGYKWDFVIFILFILFKYIFLYLHYKSVYKLYRFILMYLTGMQEDGCVTFPPQNVVPLGHSSGPWFQWGTATCSCFE